MENLQIAVRSQVLQFLLAGETFAFDVLKAREVLSMVKITPLPSSMDFLAGVINLRGSVIPVVDLRKKFAIVVASDTIDTSIIIVEVAVGDEITVIGAVVDSVKGVLLCEEKDLEAPPRFGMKMNTNLIQAIIKKDGAFIILLDVNKVFSENELWLIQSQVPTDVDTVAPVEA